MVFWRASLTRHSQVKINRHVTANSESDGFDHVTVIKTNTNLPVELMKALLNPSIVNLFVVRLLGFRSFPSAGTQADAPKLSGLGRHELVLHSSGCETNRSQGRNGVQDKGDN